MSIGELGVVKGCSHSKPLNPARLSKHVDVKVKQTANWLKLASNHLSLQDEAWPLLGQTLVFTDLFYLSCLRRVEVQASLGGGGPEGLVCQVELDAAGPEARTERVPASIPGYVLSVTSLLDIICKYCSKRESVFSFQLKTHMIYY